MTGATEGNNSGKRTNVSSITHSRDSSPFEVLGRLGNAQQFGSPSLSTIGTTCEFAHNRHNLRACLIFVAADTKISTNDKQLVGCEDHFASEQ